MKKEADYRWMMTVQSAAIMEWSTILANCGQLTKGRQSSTSAQTAGVLCYWLGVIVFVTMCGVAENNRPVWQRRLCVAYVLHQPVAQNTGHDF